MAMPCIKNSSRLNFSEKLQLINNTLNQCSRRHVVAGKYLIYAGKLNTIEGAEIEMPSWTPLRNFSKKVKPLVSNQLFLIKLCDKIQTNINPIFIQEIFKLQLEIINNALSVITLFLKNRVSDQKSLIQNENIKTLLSDVVGDIVLLEMATMDQRENIRNAINIIFKKLSKLCGGQGFLQDGLVQALWICNIVNAIYLGEMHANTRR